MAITAVSTLTDPRTKRMEGNDQQKEGGNPAPSMLNGPGLINTREWGGVRKQSQTEHAIKKGYGTEGWVWGGWRGWASAPEPPIVCGGLSKWNWHLHCSTTHAHVHPGTTRTLNSHSSSLYMSFHLISTIPIPVSLSTTFTLKTECQKGYFSNPTSLFPMPHDHVTICYICFVQFYDFS